MSGSPNRRKILNIAGAAAIAALAWPAAARSMDMDGTVTFEGGKLIPEGTIEIYLEDPAASDDALSRVAETRIESNGGSTAIAFSLPQPASAAASPTLQIVARLERADGWLLARGSAEMTAGAPMTVALSTVMY